MTERPTKARERVARPPSSVSAFEDRPSAVSLVDVSREFVLPAEVVHAVREVSLEVSAGEFVCITGASGSGKSTLLNLVAGLDLPTAGAVLVGTRRVDQLSEAARSALRLRHVGVVYQSHNLIEELSVADNIGLPLELAGVPRDPMNQEVSRVLGLVGLTGLGGRFPIELSGGQRQRVGLARGVAGSREVLVADEPTGSLDRSNADTVGRTLVALAESGVAIIVATHDPALIGKAHRVVELRDGAVAS